MDTIRFNSVSDKPKSNRERKTKVLFSEIKSLLGLQRELKAFEKQMLNLIQQIGKKNPQWYNESKETTHAMKEALGRVDRSIGQSLPVPFKRLKNHRESQSTQAFVSVLSQIRQGKVDHSSKDLMATNEVIAAMTTDHVNRLQKDVGTALDHIAKSFEGDKKVESGVKLAQGLIEDFVKGNEYSEGMNNTIDRVIKGSSSKDQPANAQEKLNAEAKRGRPTASVFSRQKDSRAM